MTTWFITRGDLDALEVSEKTGLSVCSWPIFSFESLQCRVKKAFYDVVLVTSQHVGIGIERWPESNCWLAVGPTTAAMLSKHHINALVPQEYSLSGLISDFKERLIGHHALVLTGQPVPRDYHTLLSMCHSIEVCPVYERVVSQVLPPELTRQVCARGWVLTSYAAVRYFLTIVAEKKHDIRYNDPVVVCSHQSFKEMTLAGFSLVHLANSVLLDDITKAMRSIYA